jgi:fused signal recognition particle receptor
MARGILGRLFGGKKDKTAAPDGVEQTPVEDIVDDSSGDTEPNDASADGITSKVETTAPADVEADTQPEETAEPEALVTESDSTPAPEPQTKFESQPDPEPLSDTAPVAATLAEAEVDPDQGRRSWFKKLTGGLSKSSSALKDALVGIVAKRKLDDDTLQDLEDVLIASDLGVETAMTVTESLAKGRYDKEIEESEIRAVLAEEVSKVLAPVAKPLDVNRGHAPHVVLVVGVNGTGKTTTIGKLAARLKAEGKSVLLAAGDTFRAAAIDQLKIWGERVGAPVVARETGADAAGLAFDALDQAIETGTDVVLIDTAGRLQNKADLMAELEKVIRVIQKKLPDAPHDVVLVLDATTGQNALQQVEIFGKVAGVTGLVMTKLDGTARGGILVAISAKYQMPVHAIGVGEGVDDFQPFDANEFARAIAGLT